jgi:hypothetical protein
VSESLNGFLIPTSRDFSTALTFDFVNLLDSVEENDCLGWDIFIQGELYSNSITQQGSVIHLVNVNDFSSLDSSELKNISCNNPDVSNEITQALLLGTETNLNVTCDGNNWVVSSCNGKPIICAAKYFSDCFDFGTDCSAPSFPWFSPCSNSGESNIAGGLVIGLSDSRTPPPEIRSIGFSSFSRNTLTIHVQTHSNELGQVYCDVVKTGSPPLELEAIKGASHVSRINTIESSSPSSQPPSPVVTSLNFTGLIPFTSYDVYCLSISPDGVESKLSQVLNTTITAQTKCCKSVQVRVISSFVTEQSLIENSVEVILDHAPTYDKLVIHLNSLTNHNDNDMIFSPGFGLFPSAVEVETSFQVKQPLMFSFSAPVFNQSFPGNNLHRINLTLSGISAAEEFEISVIDSRDTITVLSSVEEPTPPAMSSALFSNDGLSVRVNFDSATDRGGKNASSFTCNELFTFTGDSNAFCQWYDDSVLSILPRRVEAGDVLLSVGSSVIISSEAVIKAKCLFVSNPGLCSSWTKADVGSSTSTTIHAPEIPIEPKVVISSPSLIGACDDISIAISGSSGSGGRDWFESIIWEVDARNFSSYILGNLTAVNWAEQPVGLISSDLLVPGQSVTVSLTLVNFLGQSGRATHTVLVSGDTTLPVVEIIGQPTRRILASHELILNGNAFVTDCDGRRSDSSIRYIWSVRLNGIKTPSLVSESNDPHKFRLDPFSLEPGKSYSVQLQAIHTVSYRSTAASVFINAERSLLVAVISGANTRTVLPNDTVITLDGSSSYDEELSDSHNNGQTLSSLSYSWTCVQTRPTYDPYSCGVIFPSSPLSTHSSSIEIKYDDQLSFGAESTITLAVFDSSTLRSSRTSVTVVNRKAGAPDTSIHTIFRNGKLNPNKRIIIEGSVDFEVSSSTEWSVTPFVDLPSISLTPVSVSVQTGESSPVFIRLVLPANSLPESTTFTFSLTATSSRASSQQSVSRIELVTNGPPSPGEFVVKPSSGGVEFLTSFLFKAQLWEDYDLPLSYSFGFIDETQAGSNTVLSVRVRSETPYTSNPILLPAGPQSKDFYHSCVLQIFDTLDSSTTQITLVEVQKQVTNSELERLSNLDSIINETLSNQGFDQTSNTLIDSRKLVISTISSSLNTVNCTFYTNGFCSFTYGREGCSKKSLTCGPCKGGLFGEFGNANTACLLPQQLTRVRVSNDTSSIPQKTCPQDCSGPNRGSCIFQSNIINNGDDDDEDEEHIIESCNIFQSDCFEFYYYKVNFFPVVSSSTF